MVMKKQFNRRDFLKYSLSFAAGGATVAILNPYLKIGDRIVHLLNPGLEKPFKKAFLSMGTYVDIAIYDQNLKNDAAHILAKAEEEILAIDRLMSSFSKSSDLAKINLASGNDHAIVDGRLCEVFQGAKEISQATGGVFDPTILPLLKLYGLRDNHPVMPDRKALETTLALIDYRQISIDRDTRRIGLTKRGAAADLGAIAKGYAVDRAVAALREHGVEKAVVNAGGEIYALGTPKNQEGWEIGIQHPTQPQKLAGRIVVADKAVSTSGNYEWRVQNQDTDKKFGHLIDASTGEMAEPMLSATIVANSTMMADALSTAVFLMGHKGAEKFIASQKDVGGALILPRGKADIDVIQTGAFPRILT
ncbi:MAG: FAD:protein FMN transferase [Syntrophobacterales bacterium]|jgi:thiamine biosynthesis lipoprotein|nr:FAD:protein FMN transferase [Syntrophobacterales bacterium]